jgi:apolipoprotein N-acyltransferase
VITYVTSFALFTYLPLRAVQEGFYQPFGLTGSDVGLDQAGVLTQAAVYGGLLLGVSFLVMLLGAGIGRVCREKLNRFRGYVRVLAVLVVGFLPLIVRLLLPLSTPAPYWSAGLTWGWNSSSCC